MNQSHRPTSPHIQIYKQQLTTTLSILHRATGIILALGSVLIAFWLAIVAYNPELLQAAYQFLSSILGRLILFLFTLVLFYHLCNGIRHLYWDIGKGFELRQIHFGGWLTVVCTFVLTIAVWIVGYTYCR